MRAIIELAARVAQLEKLMQNMSRHGTVAEVNPSAGLVRLKLGEGDAGDVLSPWIPYAQTGGALKIHSPPTVGQQMSIASPGGDLSQAVATPLGFSDANPSPSSAADQHVMTFGAVTVSVGTDSVVVEVGGSTVTIGTGQVSITSPRIDLN